ncbi:DUF6843 domain-containing protein [Mesobacillus jeotgali]|uniref:DUF6843 domain-containing protein n=1 Tax=Mesobacillus jeotgali TaxID=129985 RepID=UPI000C8216C4|nr:hypothetical protein [Mesobacillus jeotgali]
MAVKRIFLLLSSIVFLAACSFEEEKTNNIFLVPEGYEGTIMVYYDIPNTPPLKKEGEYTVIPVKLEGLEELEGTHISQYGIYFTSTLDMKYGLVNDKYFYVDADGKRTKIDDYCTHGMGNGSFTGESEKEVKYQGIQITASNCGESFFLDGYEDYYIQKDAIQDHWMNHFDQHNF